ncbi:protein of unknown function [Taphrina deformans PYCC 5710]|uniref:Uncharacterized protein n=1 Tax=Taphrina deformans (strain PYCC 5710 / ATCC 11124 / CBS 356.35 / IMI 108563 / JCM 9778 / NBRC 8474) TaxID=1097556 RepID=R4XF91_TAPDE|nr:protein of unknown function [Taphrina deformans PYCC 5710]|eukprot:CCG84542.1 protein of unknown function [Taphrina deformans PYCC 5710]
MCADLVKWANKNPTGYQRLRQLSTMAVDNQTDFLGRVRRASVVHRKQSMAPPTLGMSASEIIAEEEEEEAEATDVSSLIKSLVLNDDLFGMVASPDGPAENNFTWNSTGFGGKDSSSQAKAVPFGASSPRGFSAYTESGPMSPGLTSPDFIRLENQK